MTLSRKVLYLLSLLVVTLVSTIQSGVLDLVVNDQCEEDQSAVFFSPESSEEKVVEEAFQARFDAVPPILNLDFQLLFPLTRGMQKAWWSQIQTVASKKFILFQCLKVDC